MDNLYLLIMVLMNIRNLKDGSHVESFDIPIDLIIHTKAPGKWKIFDMETGEEYIGSSLTHPKYGLILKNKVINGSVGSWIKVKIQKNNRNGII